MIGAFGEDRGRFANAFEPSASWDGSVWRWLRWSYGFSAWREDATREAGRVVSLVEAFDGRVARALESLLDLAQSPAVDLPVLGFAYDHPDAWRVKLYLVFHRDAGEGAWAIAARALGFDEAPEPTGVLHMVGADLGPGGHLGGRLYERAPEGWRLDRVGAGPLGRRALPGALLVRRLPAAPRRGALPPPRDAHIPLEDAELPQSALPEAPLLAAALRAAPEQAPWTPPQAAVRWLAVPLSGAVPVTVYYVLRAP